METKLNIISDSENEIEVSLEYDEIKEEIDAAYNEERKNISLPGFRKGKVPLPMLKKLYGGAIEFKASEKIANKKFWDVVEEQKLKPISTPQLEDINFEPGSKLFFKVKYEIKPKLDLKDYKDLEIEKPVFKVTDEMIDGEINYLLKSHAVYEDAEVIEDKNFRITVTMQRIDENNVAIVGSRNENIVLDLGDEKVNPDISKAAIGKKAGDNFHFEFNEEKSDQNETEVFKYLADITKVEKMVLPETNEEFVKKISKNKSSTIDEYKNELRSEFEKYYSSQSENIHINSLLNKVVTNNDFEPPKGYVTTIQTRLLESEKEYARRNKIPNFNESEVRTHLKPKAEWNAKWQIIVENLSEKEGIKVEDQDIENLAKMEAQDTGISVDKLIKYYKDSNRAESLLEEKVVNFLKENNKVIEVNPEDKKQKEEKTEDKKLKEVKTKKTKTTAQKPKETKSETNEEKESNPEDKKKENDEK